MGAVTVAELVEQADVPLAAALVLEQIARDGSVVFYTYPYGDYRSVAGRDEVTLRIWNASGHSLTNRRARAIARRLRTAGLNAVTPADRPNVGLVYVTVLFLARRAVTP